ncbi:unnamed protein product, partial [Iphiclides podalirius]
MVAPVDELCDELNPVKPTQVVASTSREADFSEPATPSGLARSSCRANVSIEDVYESSISEDGMGDDLFGFGLDKKKNLISVIDHDYYIHVGNWLADVSQENLWHEKCKNWLCKKLRKEWVPLNMLLLLL